MPSPQPGQKHLNLMLKSLLKWLGAHVSVGWVDTFNTDYDDINPIKSQKVFGIKFTFREPQPK